MLCGKLVEALRSCDSELHAMGSAAVEVLGVHAFVVEQGFSKEPLVVWGESSSALQLAHRQGTGRSKHAEVRLLAIQSWVSMGRLRLQKVHSAEIVADVITKRVSRNTWETLCAMLGLSPSARGSCIMSSSDMRFRCNRSRGRVIDPCTFLFSSQADTALIMWIRKCLESQVIRQTSRRPDSFLIGLYL